MAWLGRLLGRDWRREEDLPVAASKLGRILELSAGRDVLDVGCIGGDPGVDISRTSHSQIAARARSCVGIDTLESEVERWRKEGYDVVGADAEAFSFDRKFDVIVAADLIEHLGNPGRFLQRAAAHLRSDGRLCIVTPNAGSLNTAVKGILGMRVAINPEHTCWFDRTTLRQLLERYGFEVVEEYWQDYQAHPMAALIVHLRKNLAAHIILVARLRTRGTSG
ncbi:MAG TPA: class I SAM-dependent methyltransferase [Thermoplasmata archaeon]|nr:class I SAM-dependent methyltransferase [Thermoplasmata archaeon]